MCPRSARPRRASAPDPAAEPLHRAAIRLLRRLRREDAVSGVSAARLSALSVLVFAGPQSLGALAAAEQVSAPTMSRLVQAMEHEGWVERRADPDDARTVHIRARPAAVRLLHAGRDRRLRVLSAAFATLAAADRRAIRNALAPLQRLVEALQMEDAEPPPAHTGRRRPD